MVGSALMLVPILGHIVILGPLAAMLFGGLQGAVVVGGVALAWSPAVGPWHVCRG
jgi:hypothetical protein